MAKQHINPADLKRIARHGDYEAWSIEDGTYAEVRGSNGVVVKRYRGEFAHADADEKAADLAALLAHA